MSNKTRYLFWGAGLCLLLTGFSFAMIAVGIKPLSIGIVATTAALLVATIVLFVVSLRRLKKERSQ